MSLRRLGLAALVLLPLGCGAAPPPAATGAAEGAPAAAPPAAPPPSAAEPDAERKPERSASDPSDGEASAPAAAVNEAIGGGTLTQHEIRDEVVKHAELFDQCYLIGAGKSRDFIATVTVKATVGPSGAVTVSEVIKSTAKNKKVDTCVADAFKKIKFPRPKGAATSVITFPMEFQGTEEVTR